MDKLTKEAIPQKYAKAIDVVSNKPHDNKPLFARATKQLSKSGRVESESAHNQI